jgi:hypothetical protein
MTKPKSYNKQIFCSLLKLDDDCEEAENFMKLTFTEQLNTIKRIREEAAHTSSNDQEPSELSFIDRVLFKK